MAIFPARVFTRAGGAATGAGAGSGVRRLAGPFPAASLAACCKFFKLAMCVAFPVLGHEDIEPREFFGGFAVGFDFLGALAQRGRVGVNRAVA